MNKVTFDISDLFIRKVDEVMKKKVSSSAFVGRVAEAVVDEASFLIQEAAVRAIKNQFQIDIIRCVRKAIKDNPDVISGMLESSVNDLIKNLVYDPPKQVVKTEVEAPDLPIEALELTTRAENCLKSENIYFVSELALKTEPQLLKIPFLGRKTMKEIKEAMLPHGGMRNRPITMP